MVSNKPSFSTLVKFDHDYWEKAFDAVNFVDVYTYKINGVHNVTTHAYTGGTVVGYVYVQYDDALKTNLVSSHVRKV